MKTITKTLLRKVIKDVIPDPKAPGPFRVIADVGNCQYYDQRAIEAIRSGERVLAIQLLILAEATGSLRSSGEMERGPTKGKSNEGDNQGQAEVEGLRRPNDSPTEGRLDGHNV